MDIDRRLRISVLHDAALALAASERAAFLQQACAGDEALRREVESLLAFDTAAARFLETPAIALADSPVSRTRREDLVGRELGPYTLVALLGAGGMGEVYRAHDRQLGRDVALKILPPHFTADPERRARFGREARLLATLNHPHIGAIYGIADADDVSALVLELVEGPTLATRVSQGPLAIPQALRTARQIADAIQVAHQRGIVHRDLKPANIVLQDRTSGSGVASSAVHAKVLDFGLAKTMRREVEHGQLPPSGSAATAGTLADTADGRILGTPAYMSPEQARGQPVDKRTDIWAFGCVLYEMLAGHPAFDGATMSDTLVSVLDREPDWSRLPAATPTAIRTLLQRCLRKDPDHRLHDIADARIEIDEWESDRGLASAPVAARGDRSTTRFALVGILLGLACVAAIVLVWAGRQTSPPEPFEFPVGPPAQATFPSRYGGFSIAPDGRQIVVTASSTTRSSLWVRPLSTPQYREILGTDGALFPFWKPDGTEIAFFAGGKLKTVSLRGGIPTIVCDAPYLSEGASYDEVGGSWNRDGIILFMSSGFTLQKVVAHAGAVPVPVTALASGETAHRWPSFLPDGHHFLYLALGRAGDAGDLRVGSVDGGTAASLGRAESNAMYSAGHLLFLQGGELVARPFDARSRLLTGPARPVVRTPRFNMWNHLGAFSASEAGVLAHHPGGPILTDQRLTWRDRAGRITETLGEVGRYPSIDLSPDGTRVAAAFVKGDGTSDIWIFDLARGDGVPLTSDPAWEFDPTWSQDSRRIVFNSNRAGGRVNLFVRPSDGSGRDELLVNAKAAGETPVWTPRDRAIVYGDDGDIWIRRIDGGEASSSVVWRTTARERAAILSPDGRWIAFASDKSGRSEIYVRAFPSGDVEHKVSLDGGMAPRWRGDARELFFLSLDVAMMAARVDTANDFHVTNPESLFATGLSLITLRPYAVARDGQRFLVPTAVDPRAHSAITVVINWPASIPH